MNDSEAQRLLQFAAQEDNRLRRHLLVAAALRAILSRDPIIVGGTAEEYWTADAYHETDLDMCVPLSVADKKALDDFGFDRKGRHWEIQLGDHWVAVEFPDTRIDGDNGRTVEVTARGGAARIIGLDDLYLDRLRQATISNHEGIEFRSAQAVVAARYDEIDWAYVNSRIQAIQQDNDLVGTEMKKINSRIRRRVRQKTSEVP